MRTMITSDEATRRVHLPHSARDDFNSGEARSQLCGGRPKGRKKKDLLSFIRHARRLHKPRSRRAPHKRISRAQDLRLGRRSLFTGRDWPIRFKRDGPQVVKSDADV